VTTGFKIR